jgi:hypothetical protein
MISLVQQLGNYSKFLRVTRHGIQVFGVHKYTQKPCQTSNPRPLAREKSWLTRKVESSPSAMKIFLKLTNFLGYGSPKQIAGRRAFALYDQVCAVKPDQDRSFWQDGVFDPTFEALPLKSFRMLSTTNISVLVYGNQPPCLASYCSTTCTSPGAWKVLYPSSR